MDIKYKIFFVSDDRMQKLFDQKELQIKISVMQFTFNELCFVTIHEKPWAVAREVCRALEYGKATKNADIVKRLCSRNNYAHKWQLTELVSETNFMDWPRDSRKDDYYINGEGMYELVFSSQQPKTKNFRKHCCNVMLPWIRQQLVHKMKEYHQQAIEEKDAALAYRDNQIQGIQYENAALQAQRDVYQAHLQRCQDTISHLRPSYVDHAKDPRKYSIIIIIRKHTMPANDKYYNLPYYVARIQRRKRYAKLR